MTKLLFASFIVLFWVLFPLIISFFYSSCFVQINDTYVNTIKEPTGFDFFSGLWDFVKILFQMMFLTIPCAPKWLSVITWSMSFITGLVIYLFIRGG